MDLHAFKNAPGVDRLLVRLHESHELYSKADDNRPQARRELTKAVAGLLEVDLSQTETELLADVLIALVRQAEVDLRAALVDKLASMPNVPLRLALQLANDEIIVSAPFLKQSPVLNDLDLVYIIKSQGNAYWQAIAGRENLSSQVIDVLADTKDRGTAMVLSSNERATLTKHALNILGIMACNDEELARPLLKRPEVPPTLARKLYAHVGKELREYIDQHFEEETPDNISDAVHEAFSDFSKGRRERFMPSPEMLLAVEKMDRAGRVNLDTMMEALNRGHISLFIALFAKYSGLKAELVHRFLRKSCPKGMAIACRAYHLQKSDFSRIFLLTNKMRSKSRMINHRDMLMTLSYFDKVKPDIAQRIVHRESVGASGRH